MISFCDRLEKLKNLYVVFGVFHDTSKEPIMVGQSNTLSGARSQITHYKKREYRKKKYYNIPNSISDYFIYKLVAYNNELQWECVEVKKGENK